MLHRVRLSLKENRSRDKLGGNPNSEVETDETFIGGHKRNMHADEISATRSKVEHPARPLCRDSLTVIFAKFAPRSSPM